MSNWTATWIFTSRLSKLSSTWIFAHELDAVLHQKFYFRQDLFSRRSPPFSPVENEYRFMIVDEIINDRTQDFLELLPLVRKYVNVEYADTNAAFRLWIRRYLNLMQGRASGRVSTPARWIMSFIREHTTIMATAYWGRRFPTTCWRRCSILEEEGRDGIEREFLQANW